MTPRALPWAAAVLALAVAAPARSAPPELLHAGAEKARHERCVECHITQPHDPERNGTSSERFPKLVGQAQPYLAKQLRDFREGARRHEMMSVMARDLSDADIHEITHYFASLPTMQGPAAQPAPEEPAVYTHGDPARGIAPCASCHGPQGKQPVAGGVPTPLIGGQERPYIEYQLRDWRSGDRRNSPADLMNQQTRALTEREIEALARYLAAQ